jgi:hypothetical protein
MLYLVETEDTWLVVAEEIQRGRCRIEQFILDLFIAQSMSTNNVFIAVVNAIKHLGNIESLRLPAGSAGSRAESLKANTTLRQVKLD